MRRLEVDRSMITQLRLLVALHVVSHQHSEAVPGSPVFRVQFDGAPTSSFCLVTALKIRENYAQAEPWLVDLWVQLDGPTISAFGLLVAFQAKHEHVA